MYNKRVLVVIDKAEKTASRNKSSDDLVSQWTSLISGSDSVPYVVAYSGLPVGDVWFCEIDESFVVPDDHLLKKQPTFFQTEKSVQTEKPKQTNKADIQTDDLPTPSFSMDHLLSSTSDQTKKRATESIDWLPTPRIIVERKTVSDLLSSLSDGRYRDQKCRLVNSEAKNVVILVEGFDSKKVNDPRTKKTLLSIFSNTMFRDQITVYHTRSLVETFEFLHHTGLQFASGDLERDEQYFERKLPFIELKHYVNGFFVKRDEIH